MITIHCKLLAKSFDYEDYKTLVFENLDTREFDRQYLMCTVFPNWNSYIPEIYDEGYLTYKEVEAGKDTWFDGSSFIPYNYSNIIFIKFILKEDKSIKKDIII